MGDQESVANIEGPAAENSFKTNPLSRPTRRDSESTISSENYSRLPPGYYKLDIHGNCPRCHHHHSGTTILVKISDEANHVSHADCKNCKKRWLAFGGRNTTRISLLSTQTTEPDNVEINFRYTLISMVQSATAIASPTLANIPESSSRIPSRDPSIRTPDRDAGALNASTITGLRSAENQDITLETGEAQGELTSGTASTPSTNRVVPTSESERARNAFRRLKARLKDKFPKLKKIPFPHLRKSLKEPNITEKGKGKLPVGQSQCTEDGSAMDKPSKPNRFADSDNENKEPKSERDTTDACTLLNGSNLAKDIIHNFDKEAIRTMSHDERVRWIREQFTTFKRRPSPDCLASATPLMINTSTQVHPTELPPLLLRQPRRRHSVDLLGLGSHFGYFDEFGTSSHALYNGQLSIPYTPTSQADTAVDSTTVSSPRNSLLGAVLRQRSPTPVSITSRPQSWQQIRQTGLEPRASMDSIATGGAVRSILGYGRAGTDRFSTASPTPTSIYVRTEPSRSQIRVQELMTDDHDLSTAGYNSSSRSALNVSGHHTSNERNLDSESDNEVTPTQSTRPPRADDL